MKILSSMCSICFISFLLVSCGNNNSTGSEGQWNSFKYSYNASPLGGTKKIVEREDKVMVVNSTYHNYKGRTQLIVFWKVLNTSKEPTDFGWTNKVVMDNEGKIYKPYEGYDSEVLQPMDESSTLRIAYNFSSAVNINKLVWGFYQDNIEEGLKYKIKLSPKQNIN